MATFSVNVGIQTEENEASCIKSDVEGSSDSEGEHIFGLKHLFDDSSSDGCGSQFSKLMEDSSETDSCILSTTCSSTRRSSLVSDSDLELPFHNLFRSSSSSNGATTRISTPVTSSSSSTVLDGIDLLLQRLESERFLELRNIQLEERPVTGRNSRESLDSFFRRAIHGLSEDEQREQEEANRPENVVNDVHTLQEQSIVQSTLQTEFATRLERALSSRMQNVNAPTQTRRRPVRSFQNSSVGGSAFRTQLENMYADRISQTQPTRRNTVYQRQPRATTQDTTQQNLPTNTHTAPSRIPPPPPALDTVYESPQTSNLQITIETGLQLLTESITEDLTRLQSLQVVSNMLRTDFRDQLESMVQSRVQNVGNGEAVEEFVRSLPPPTRQPQRSLHQNSQLAASINESTTAELNGLRRQVEEMKRMMAMSMEIQLDTQRAIRQEVSAVFSAFMRNMMMSNPQDQGSPQQPTLIHPPRSTTVSSGQCVICIDQNVDTVLYQCGHMCVCHRCGLQLKIDGHNCPMCRAPIRDVIRAYQTQ